MSSIRVPQGSTVSLDKVEGDLHVSKNATVKAKDSQIMVSGAIRCEGDCTFDCSVSALSLRGRNCEIAVTGDLSIERSIIVDDGSLNVDGSLTAREVEVDRKLNVGRDLTANNIRVGRTLKIGGNTKAENVNVGGKFEAQGNVNIKDLDVGGKAEVNGSITGSSLNVGGAFHGKGIVKVDDI
ncbi:MAG TPA: hypothetical protein ENH03_00640, partial [Candidatus Bathyarchaeota archaeon]|nr:hypothetical protein [Candidatus Bathyarchaeota archaeon]